MVRDHGKLGGMGLGWVSVFLKHDPVSVRARRVNMLLGRGGGGEDT